MPQHVIDLEKKHENKILRSEQNSVINVSAFSPRGKPQSVAQVWQNHHAEDDMISIALECKKATHEHNHSSLQTWTLRCLFGCPCCSWLEFMSLWQLWIFLVDKMRLSYVCWDSGYLPGWYCVMVRGDINGLFFILYLNNSNTCEGYYEGKISHCHCKSSLFCNLLLFESPLDYDPVVLSFIPDSFMYLIKFSSEPLPVFHRRQSFTASWSKNHLFAHVSWQALNFFIQKRAFSL